MNKFIEVIDVQGGIKKMHRISKDNIGDIVTEDNSEQLKFEIAIFDKLGKEIFSKKFQDAYEFDNFVEKIMKQIENE